MSEARVLYAGEVDLQSVNRACEQQGEGRKGWRIGFLASGSPNGLDASR